VQSQLWQVLDPASEFRVAPSGYDAGNAADPSRQTVGVNTPWYSPESSNFGFGLVLVGVFAGLYYVFEHGGVGAGAKAHLGPARAEADAELGGK
jgi:hypothetical protein